MAVNTLQIRTHKVAHTPLLIRNGKGSIHHRQAKLSNHTIIFVNDALLEQVGTAVEAGQAVAQAGTSGGAADSGVYFELRHNGIAFDPKQWFSGR